MNLYDNQPLTVAELRRLQALENRYRNAAREVFTNRVEYYHRFTGGHYTSITIRDQKTRWGSCSSRGTLSFNYRLIYGPAGPLDYVVVHELCHLTHMNHSKDFWNMVERIMPDYRIYKQWLRSVFQQTAIFYYSALRSAIFRLSVLVYIDLYTALNDTCHISRTLLS